MTDMPAAVSSPAAEVHTGDNLLGICAAIGADFGFNPLWLRVALAMVVLVNMEIALGVYLALGAIVAISHVIAPAGRRLPAMV